MNEHAIVGKCDGIDYTTGVSSPKPKKVSVVLSPEVMVGIRNWLKQEEVMNLPKQDKHSLIAAANRRIRPKKKLKLTNKKSSA